MPTNAAPVNSLATFYSLVKAASLILFRPNANIEVEIPYNGMQHQLLGGYGMSTSRRTFLGASIGAIAASQGLPARSQNSPIRIGCITTLSGAAGILGKPQHQGMLLAAKRINESGGILGRQIEIIVRDDQSKPDVAVAAVRELAGSGVRIFAGVLASPVALAISGIAEELDSVFLNAASHGNNLTHENFRKNYFRLTDYSAMRISAGSRLMAERYSDVAKWGAIIPDAEIGRSTMATFRFAMPKYYMQLHKKAVTVNEPVVVKFGATDYRNAISTLLSSDIDGIFVGLGGGDEVGFLQQAGQLGLSKRIKVYVTSGSDFQAAKALGKRTPENYWSGHHWYFGAYAGNPISDALYNAVCRRNQRQIPRRVHRHGTHGRISRRGRRGEGRRPVDQSADRRARRPVVRHGQGQGDDPCRKTTRRSATSTTSSLLPTRARRAGPSPTTTRRTAPNSLVRRRRARRSSSSSSGRGRAEGGSLSSSAALRYPCGSGGGVPSATELRHSARPGYSAAAGAVDASNRFNQRFADDFHVVAICVKQFGFVAHHPDMAFPEHEIAATQA